MHTRALCAKPLPLPPPFDLNQFCSDTLSLHFFPRNMSAAAAAGNESSTSTRIVQEERKEEEENDDDDSSAKETQNTIHRGGGNSNNNCDDYGAYRVALYYCYICINNNNNGVPKHLEFQRQICTELQLMGRIRVSSEGINGVLSGKQEDLVFYEKQLRQELQKIQLSNEEDRQQQRQPQPWELDVKYCQFRRDLPLEAQLFDSLSCKQTSQVVSLVELEHNTNNNNVDGGGSDNNSNKNRRPSYASRRRRKKREEKQKKEREKLGEGQNCDAPSSSSFHLHQRAQEVFSKSLEQLNTASSQKEAPEPVPHLSPLEWNRQLQELSADERNKVVLLDCRNVYESAIGHFRAPNCSTMLTNTRKYSELPAVMLQQADNLAKSSHIFMYCTGGVRCERAGLFLQTMLEENNNETTNEAPSLETRKRVPQIYQLHGGIQKYLEVTARSTDTLADSSANHKKNDTACFYQGKNFVFDPRRVDPVHHNHHPNDNGGDDNDAISSNVVGKCLVCSSAWDDYDGGHAPRDDKETRCCKCRVLILVCPACRNKVLCWGDSNNGDGENNNKDKEVRIMGASGCDQSSPSSRKPRMYCGGLEQECWHMPPVQNIC